jgi:hypothetical protein
LPPDFGWGPTLRVVPQCQTFASLPASHRQSASRIVWCNNFWTKLDWNLRIFVQKFNITINRQIFIYFFNYKKYIVFNQKTTHRLKIREEGPWGFNLFLVGGGSLRLWNTLEEGTPFWCIFMNKFLEKFWREYLPALPLAGVQQCKQDNKINIWNKIFFNTADTLLYKRD